MTTAVSPSVGKGKNKTYDPYALRKSAKTPWGNPVVYFFSLLLVALCVGPVLYIIIGGFRTNAQITRDPAGWPDPWNFENYKTVFTSNIFWPELVNSLIVSIGTMVGIVVLALMVSFVIARYEFKFNKLLYSLFAAGMMFPITVAITPLYLLLRNLHLINSHLGIILPQIAFGLPRRVLQQSGRRIHFHRSAHHQYFVGLRYPIGSGFNQRHRLAKPNNVRTEL